MAAWYLLIGMSNQLTGQTNAFFNDHDAITGTIQVGTWESDEETEDSPGCSENGNHGDWDCSSLKFMDQGFDGIEIFATVKNTGSTMNRDGTYQIYYSETGNPKDGKLLTETLLTFESIGEGETLRLSYTPTQNGKYMFKAYQHEDHPGTGELWSEEVVVSLTVNPAGDTAQPDQVEEPASKDAADNTEKEIQKEPSNEKAEEQPIEQPIEQPVEQPADENAGPIQEEPTDKDVIDPTVPEDKQ